VTRRDWARRGVVAAMAAVGVGVAVIVGVPPAVAVRLGSYVVLAVFVESAVRLLGPMAPPGSRSLFTVVARPPRRRPVVPPEQLEELQRRVWAGVRSVGGWHYRLRPVLRDVADALLEDRHGVRLDRDPAASRAILGPRAWDLLRPDVDAPGDRWADGLAVDELDALVGRIEKL
jgi:hypothetical protein